MYAALWAREALSLMQGTYDLRPMSLNSDVFSLSLSHCLITATIVYFS